MKAQSNIRKKTLVNLGVSYYRNDERYRQFEGGTTEKSPPDLALIFIEGSLIFETAKNEKNRKKY